MTGSWLYPRCLVLSVYDGDTVRVDIDLGQDVWIRNRPVRLAGLAARELREPGGIAARDHLAALLPPGTRVSIESTGWDKYGGRITGRITLSDGRVLADLLVAAGYALPWNGRGAQPKPPWPTLTTMVN